MCIRDSHATVSELDGEIQMTRNREDEENRGIDATPIDAMTYNTGIRPLRVDDSQVVELVYEDRQKSGEEANGEATHTHVDFVSFRAVHGVTSADFREMSSVSIQREETSPSNMKDNDGDSGMFRGISRTRLGDDSSFILRDMSESRIERFNEGEEEKGNEVIEDRGEERIYEMGGLKNESVEAEEQSEDRRHYLEYINDGQHDSHFIPGNTGID
eukprot:TRINITY_DN28126_c0_g1_i2.p1 TRINITY_DN28126_c0_g1~~TRINITY_DN28126_c0_g1_i2.p1  ORF type:complete len:235 (+),score=44.80 TRINITY_DN28126_c0_g1_i2:61-705(+)